jgi:hypothetical protein
MGDEQRRLAVALPNRLYVELARLAAEGRTSMSQLVCDAIELLVQTRIDPDMSVRMPMEPCIDPDKMHGAADGFGGSDEGSQYDLKRPR